MISNSAGISLKKNIRPKVWWIKLGVGLFLSNVFFFLLFSGESPKEVSHSIPKGWVEIQVRADLLTPFHFGKKVLLVHRQSRKQIESMLQAIPQETDGRFTVLVKESEAHFLFQHENWEILPYLKSLSFVQVPKGDFHEIRY